MDSKEGLVDLSCFFLLEGSADSEADQTAPLKANNTKIAIAVEDGDEESCNSGTIGVTFGHKACEALDNCKDYWQWQSWCRNYYTMWVWAGDAGLGYEEEEVESKQLVGGVNMDEMEDRLFWETCMELGYP